MNRQAPIRVLRELPAYLRLVAVLALALSLLSPYLYGFAPEIAEKCACCANGKSCCRRARKHGGGPAFSGGMACPMGCMQSPAVASSGPAVLGAQTGQAEATAHTALILLPGRPVLPARPPAFALFQRPPPSV